MYNDIKKVACIHDLSCYSRCSLLVALPVLNFFGCNACPLPTALLSTHTGGYTDYTFLDLSDEMKKIACHWKKLGAKFDAIYSGFLGSEEQIDIVSDFIQDFSKENTIILVDPVMGDDGEIYRTYTKEMCGKMYKLCKKADIITPNLTEAFLLCGRDYNVNPSDDEIKTLLEELSLLMKKEKKLIVITGIRRGDKIGVAYFDLLSSCQEKEYKFSFAPHCNVFYSGVGELLASVLLAMIIRGASAEHAINQAVDFISRVSFRTAEMHSYNLEGVAFEDMLDTLSLF